MSSTLYPDVVDLSTLSPVYSAPQFLGIGVEGQMDNAGSASVGSRYSIVRPGDADTLFGPVSSLSALVKFLLNKGVGVVQASPSAKGTSPDLTARQAAWTLLEERRDIRIRLTDSTTQADLVALANSAEWAEGIQHKQIAFGGMPTGTTASALATAAGAIDSKRGVLVGPGIYDIDGTLRSGAYAAAWIAAIVSQNQDISDDLDTLAIPGALDVERTSAGLTMFRIKAGAGTPVNDYETALQAGVSPLRPGLNGGVEITHLRTTLVRTPDNYDALMTVMIEDQVFEEVRITAEEANTLRTPNNAKNRSRLAARVEARLGQLNNWIEPKQLPDGNIGYGAVVGVGADPREMAISYQGNIVRGTQRVAVKGNLTIAA